MENITLVTGNPNKKREIVEILGFDIHTQPLELPEIQSFNLEEIVREKVAEAYKRIGSAVLVEDVGFYMDALNGFPGPFIKFWYQQKCHELDAAIAAALSNDRAYARSGVGYADGERVLYVESCVPGRIVSHRGDDGWGFDFYFAPDGFGGKSFAELGPEAKNKTSHRGIAFTLMREKLEELS